MKKLALTLVLAVLLIPSLPVTARTQSADEIIEKHIAALGGRAALAKITSRKSVGTVTISTPNGDIPGSVETYLKAPNKSRALLKLDLSAMGLPEPMVVDQKFDGTTGWTLDSVQGDAQITGVQLDNMRNASFPSAMLTYKEQGTRAEVLPQETIGGKTYVVIQFTPKTGSVSKAYFDPQTWLLARTTARISAPDVGELEQVSEPSDYRAVDGVQVPFTVVQSSPMQSITIKLTSVDHAAAIDDAMFSVK